MLSLCLHMNPHDLFIAKFPRRFLPVCTDTTLDHNGVPVPSPYPLSCPLGGGLLIVIDSNPVELHHHRVNHAHGFTSLQTFRLLLYGFPKSIAHPQSIETANSASRQCPQARRCSKRWTSATMKSFSVAAHRNLLVEHRR